MNLEKIIDKIEETTFAAGRTILGTGVGVYILLGLFDLSKLNSTTINAEPDILNLIAIGAGTGFVGYASYKLPNIWNSAKNFVRTGLSYFGYELPKKKTVSRAAIANRKLIKRLTGLFLGAWLAQGIAGIKYPQFKTSPDPIQYVYSVASFINKKTDFDVRERNEDYLNDAFKIRNLEIDACKLELKKIIHTWNLCSDFHYCRCLLGWSFDIPNIESRNNNYFSFHYDILGNLSGYTFPYATYFHPYDDIVENKKFIKYVLKPIMLPNLIIQSKKEKKSCYDLEYDHAHTEDHHLYCGTHSFPLKYITYLASDAVIIPNEHGFNGSRLDFVFFCKKFSVRTENENEQKSIFGSPIENAIIQGKSLFKSYFKKVDREDHVRYELNKVYLQFARLLEDGTIHYYERDADGTEREIKDTSELLDFDCEMKTRKVSALLPSLIINSND